MAIGKKRKRRNVASQITNYFHSFPQVLLPNNLLKLMLSMHKITCYHIQLVSFKPKMVKFANSIFLGTLSSVRYLCYVLCF